ncbi:Type I transmembrane sorting receptor [Boothiomyces sp. JEL0838]|nr:Type I transmembrane sorting receptor [Boothiomyces sp. JEL0838]
MQTIAVVSALTMSLAAKTVIPMQRRIPSTPDSSLFRHQQLHAQINDAVHQAGLGAELDNIQNSFYACPLTVGSGQNFTLDLDTGSSDTWFKGSNCVDLAGDGSCKGPVIQLSDTAVKKMPNVSEVFDQYGSGNATFDVYTADVTIGGATAKSLPIGVASKVYTIGQEGLVGLAFNDLSSIGGAFGGNANFFDYLKFPQEKNKFGFYLSNFDDGDSGEVTFGGVDETKFTGDFNYYDVHTFHSKKTKKDYTLWWAFDIQQWTLSVGNNLTHYNFSNPTEYGIADTGTTLLSLRYDAAEKLNAAIPGTVEAAPNAGVWNISCDATGLPDVTFNDGKGVEYVIPPEVYVWKYDYDNNLCYTGFSGQPDSPIYINTVIFGDIFLRNYYSVYDKSTTPARVGFAKAVHTKVTHTTTTTAAPTTTAAATTAGQATTNAGQSASAAATTPCTTTVPTTAAGNPTNPSNPAGYPQTTDAPVPAVTYGNGPSYPSTTGDIPVTKATGNYGSGDIPKGKGPSGTYGNGDIPKGKGLSGYGNGNVPAQNTDIPVAQSTPCAGDIPVTTATQAAYGNGPIVNGAVKTTAYGLLSLVALLL